MSIYDFKVKKRKEGELDLAELKGKVVLVVNTATGCGFTPQYEGLEKLYELYHDAGFEIILWSARLEKDYIEAYQRCIEEFDMPYIRMDSNKLIHGSTGKLVARFYIDDRAYPNSKVPWRKIYKYLIKKYGKN